MFKSVVCKVSGSSLKITSGCLLALDSFATDVDWIMNRVTEKGTNVVMFSPDAYTDLDFADDMCLLPLQFAGRVTVTADRCLRGDG